MASRASDPDPRRLLEAFPPRSALPGDPRPQRRAAWRMRRAAPRAGIGRSDDSAGTRPRGASGRKRSSRRRGWGAIAASHGIFKSFCGRTAAKGRNSAHESTDSCDVPLHHDLNAEL